MTCRNKSLMKNRGNEIVMRPKVYSTAPDSGVTGQLADTPTRGLDISRTRQLQVFNMKWKESQSGGTKEVGQATMVAHWEQVTVCTAE